MAAPVRTVVFPAAGLGTRILPATKAFPKELLPLVDRPIIQYGVEEAVAAGIRRVVLVTSPGNTMTGAHFAPHPALEALLEARGKAESLAVVRALSTLAEVTTVHQAQPLGLGHAVLMARPEVGDEPFAVVLPDDVIDADPPALRRMTDLFAAVGAPVLLVERVPREAVQRYGIIDATPLGEGVFQVRDLVEKPDPATAPSDLAIVGRYVLTPDTYSTRWKRPARTPAVRSSSPTACAACWSTGRSMPASWSAPATTRATAWVFSRPRSTLRSSVRTSRRSCGRS